MFQNLRSKGISCGSICFDHVLKRSKFSAINVSRKTDQIVKLDDRIESKLFLGHLHLLAGLKGEDLKSVNENV